ncbi:hypothetical protein WOC68_12590 [Staphylococcus aureus]
MTLHKPVPKYRAAMLELNEINQGRSNIRTSTVSRQSNPLE